MCIGAQRVTVMLSAQDDETSDNDGLGVTELKKSDKQGHAQMYAEAWNVAAQHIISKSKTSQSLGPTAIVHCILISNYCWNGRPSTLHLDIANASVSICEDTAIRYPKIK